MADFATRKAGANSRLPPEVNRILYVRNLPFKVTPEELYEIFGKYGAVFQIRRGTARDTRGTAFVVYEDIYDAKRAVTTYRDSTSVAGILWYYTTSQRSSSGGLTPRRRRRS